MVSDIESDEFVHQATFSTSLTLKMASVGRGLLTNRGFRKSLNLCVFSRSYSNKSSFKVLNNVPVKYLYLISGGLVAITLAKWKSNSTVHSLQLRNKVRKFLLAISCLTMSIVKFCNHYYCLGI